MAKLLADTGIVVTFCDLTVDPFVWLGKHPRPLFDLQSGKGAVRDGGCDLAGVDGRAPALHPLRRIRRLRAGDQAPGAVGVLRLRIAALKG